MQPSPRDVVIVSAYVEVHGANCLHRPRTTGRANGERASRAALCLGGVATGSDRSAKTVNMNLIHESGFASRGRGRHGCEREQRRSRSGAALRPRRAADEPLRWRNAEAVTPRPHERMSAARGDRPQDGRPCRNVARLRAARLLGAGYSRPGSSQRIRGAGVHGAPRPWPRPGSGPTAERRDTLRSHSERSDGNRRTITTTHHFNTGHFNTRINTPRTVFCYIG